MTDMKADAIMKKSLKVMVDQNRQEEKDISMNFQRDMMRSCKNTPRKRGQHLQIKKI